MLLLTGITLVLIILTISVYQIQKYAETPSNGEVDTLECLEREINKLYN